MTKLWPVKGLEWPLCRFVPVYNGVYQHWWNARSRAVPFFRKRVPSRLSRD